MNTITGTIKVQHIPGFIIKYSSAVIFLLFIACKSNTDEGEGEIKPRSDVMVTNPVIKNATIIEEFQGVTRYIQTIEIKAHFSGIVTKVNCKLSDKISTNQALFEIKPREASVLEKTNKGNRLLQTSGDTVFAFSSGIVNQINVQPGDFVQEGDLLATCVEQNSLRVVVYIPLEKDITKIQNQSCKVLFPNGKEISGTIGASLPSANETDQTSAFLVQLKGITTPAENIHVKIKVDAGKIDKGMFVPKSAVYSNEEQSRFWILKIQNDSLAIQVPIEKGIIGDSLVQILNSEIKSSDRIVFKGGYGLSDSALVKPIGKD
jgi:multidrug efflux pump subunit AcrA (membrane-fusion protein)